MLPLAGVGVLGLELWGIGRPSLWADEVATISGAKRSIGSLLGMLHNIDAVHGTYYLFMHYWIHLFGISEVSLRVPSAVAVALTSIVVFFIAKNRFDERVAWFALLITAVIPRLSWAATEARSYGIATLLATMMLLLFFLAIDEAEPKRERILWVAYTFALALAMFFFVYIALMAAAQGLWLLRTRRDKFRKWITAVLIAIAVTGYLIYNVIYEKGQVGWLPPLSRGTINQIFMGQAFWTNWEVAYFANGLILVVLLGAVHPSRTVTAVERSTLNLFGLIIVVPTAVVLLYSLIDSSIYDARYFTFVAPVVAITMSVAVERLFTKRVALAVLALLIALSMFSYGYFRSPDAKGTHWSEVAKMVGAHAVAGDGILFTDFTRPSPKLSRLPIAFPGDFKGLVDVTREKSYFNTAELYDKRKPLAKEMTRLSALKTVVVLTDPAELKQYFAVDKVLTRAGFKLGKVYSAAASRLYTYSR